MQLGHCYLNMFKNEGGAKPELQNIRTAAFHTFLSFQIFNIYLLRNLIYSNFLGLKPALFPVLKKIVTIIKVFVE